MNIEKALGLTEMAIIDNSKLYDLRSYLQNALSEQIAKQKGGQTEKNRLTTAKKYIQNCIKKYEYRKNMHGVWYDDNYNYQYLTDSHSAFKLYSHIQGLPELDKEIEKLKIEEIFKGFDKHSLAELPSITDLKLQCKLAKAELKALNKKYKLMADVEHGLIQVGNSYYDVERIITVLDILGHDNIQVYVDNNSELSILYFKGNKGEAILCAVKKPNNYEN